MNANHLARCRYAHEEAHVRALKPGDLSLRTVRLVALANSGNLNAEPGTALEAARDAEACARAMEGADAWSTGQANSHRPMDKFSTKPAMQRHSSSSGAEMQATMSRSAHSGTIKKERERKDLCHVSRLLKTIRAMLGNNDCATWCSCSRPQYHASKL